MHRCERFLKQKPLVSKLNSLSKTRKYQRDLVSCVGFEPMTSSLKGAMFLIFFSQFMVHWHIISQ